MKEFVLGGFAYVPAWFAGRWFSHHGIDPYVVGWVASATATFILTLLRSMTTPRLTR